MLNEFNLAIMVLMAFYSSPIAVHAQDPAPTGTVTAIAPTVSWYYLGVARSNYSLTVNTGSTLVLGCLAKAKNAKLVAATSLLNPAFVIIKGSAPTLTISLGTVTPAGLADTTTPAAGTPFSVTATGGTLLWDSINGNAPGFDHILAISSMPTTTVASPASGYVQLYIPSLVASDAGLYYCTFYDASDATTTTLAKTSYANSGWFSLTLTTKSGSGSSKNAERNKALEYSIALLGASRMLF